MFKVLVFFLLFVVQGLSKQINIAVAANVSYAIEDLKKEFREIAPNIKVNVTLGSSGKLTAQIKNGAPYDLFLSANMKYPQALYDDKIATTTPKVYAQGLLAILSNKKRDFTQGINIVESDNIEKIAVANSKTAPYGIATFEVLKNSNLLEVIKHKFIYGESISQTVSYTMIAADIGFIAKSSLYSPKMKRFVENKHWIELDTKLYTPIQQGIVTLKHGEDKKAVKEFYEFMLSLKAQKVLQKFGYITNG